MRNEMSSHEEAAMQSAIPKYVTQARASIMLGIPVSELSRISHESGFGHTEFAGTEQETFFTYEELRLICLMTQQVVH